MTNEISAEFSPEGLTPTEPKGYNNHSMHKLFQDLVISKMSDVQFVFELDDEVVKIPAHKVILSASSPVFDAMFNGDLKEKGDVKIVDASPDAFKEFLQFFYEDQVKLTMDNIGYVMNLVNKYDVAECWPNCIKFLKENLTLDEILWTLHLALKFELDDLKVLCESIIEKNITKVMEMFELGNSGEVSLLSNPIKRFIPEKDVKNVFVCIFSISKKVLSGLSIKNKQLREKCILPITLSNKNTVGFDEKDKLKEKEVIYFKLDGSLLLTDIYFSNIYSYNCSRVDANFNLFIKEKLPNSHSKILVEKSIKIDKSGESHIKLCPINIKANYIYSIILKSGYSRYSNSATIPNDPVKLTEGVNISFPKKNVNSYTRSLIHRLHFQEIFDE